MTIPQAKKILEQIPTTFELMRVTDAAFRVGLNPETIRRRIRSGEIVAYGRPQRVFIRDLLPPHDVGVAGNGGK